MKEHFQPLFDAPPEFWMQPLILIFVFWFGCIWGSFLNVCIYRVQAGISLSYPPSTCPTCDQRIKWYDNIPIISWIVLGGKCRSCGMKISFRYPFVEGLTGAFFVAVWMMYGLTWLSPVYWLVMFGLLWGTFVDIDEQWIPDRVTYGGMILGIPLSALVPAMHGATTWQASLFASLIGAGIGFGLLWLVMVLGKMAFKKDAMGFGDVKLMGAVGAMLGWQAVLFTIFAGSLFGSIGGISMIAMKKTELSQKIAFGPYLAAGAACWIFGGDKIADWYMNLYKLPAQPPVMWLLGQ